MIVSFTQYFLTYLSILLTFIYIIQNRRLVPGNFVFIQNCFASFIGSYLGNQTYNYYYIICLSVHLIQLYLHMLNSWTTQCYLYNSILY